MHQVVADNPLFYSTISYLYEVMRRLSIVALSEKASNVSFKSEKLYKNTFMCCFFLDEQNVV